MTASNLNGLCQVLDKLGYKAAVQEETGQVYFTVEGKDLQFPVFCRFMANRQFLQMIAFLPGNTEEATINDTSRLLHMINREIDLPGFCVDEQNKVAFYRVLLPLTGGQASEELIEAYTATMCTVMETFSNVAFSVIQGRMTLQNVLDKAKEMEGGAS